MNTQEKIIACKNDLANLVKSSVEILNKERKSKHSMHNLAQDFKDNLHVDFPEFCRAHSFEYVRSGLSQKIVIDGCDIKIKIHNSLCKYKRNIVNKIEQGRQLQLFEENNSLIIKEAEWELGIELSKNRDKLLHIRLADFQNEQVIPLYEYSTSEELLIDSVVTMVVPKNKIRSKIVERQKKEIRINEI